MYSLPKTIELNDREYSIRAGGDYRMVLDCFSVLNDSDLDDVEKTVAFLLIFYDVFESIEDVIQEEHSQELMDKAFSFINCNQDDCPARKMNYKVIDWHDDEQLICSAVNAVAKTEVRDIEYMHWWTFLGYFNSVGESTLSTVVSLRTKMAKQEKLEKYEKKFIHDCPQYFTMDMRTKEQKEADDLIDKLWNGGAC